MSFFQKLCPSPFSPASVLVFFWVHGCSAVSCDFVFMRRGGCPYTPPSCLHSLHFEFVFIDVSFPFLPLSSSLEIWWLSLVLYLDYFFFLVYLLEIFVLWLLWYFCIGSPFICAWFQLLISLFFGCFGSLLLWAGFLLRQEGPLCVVVWGLLIAADSLAAEHGL